MDASDTLTLSDEQAAPGARREPANHSFEQRFAEALRRRLYPRTRLRLKTLSRDTGYSEDTITRWTQAKHRVFAGAVEDMATYFAERFEDYGLMYEIFGRVAGWALVPPASVAPAGRWPMAGTIPPAERGGHLLAAGDSPHP
ncbi:MAG TPA: hypothetical protein VMH36_11905 [Alphaproteobacteria bacterium]|nr:hypothetical protein [Alphaproteobacteria bacterium]